MSVRRVAMCGNPVLLAFSLYFVVRHIVQKQGEQSRGGIKSEKESEK